MLDRIGTRSVLKKYFYSVFHKVLEWELGFT